MYSRLSLLAWWIMLGIIGFHLLYKKITHKLDNFIGKPPSIPRWAIPLIITAIIGFVYICFLTITYIINPNWTFSFLLPIQILKTEIIEIIGSVLTVIGTLIFMAAYFNLGVSTRLLLTESSDSAQLRVSGLYSISRNPLYLGLHISIIGFCFIIPTWSMIIFTIIFLVNQDFRIKTEEKELELQFGAAYLEYKQKVRRYIGRRGVKK